MIYKFAEQLKAKLVEAKSNEIVDLLALLNNALAEKADVHKIEEQYKAKNANLIKKIGNISESIIMDLDLRRLFLFREKN